jgi:translocation and assembly module TamA
MLVASAAAISAGVAGAAWADEPKAKVEGVEDRSLRQAIERLIGETRSPPETRYIARRRANEAAEAAVVVLRSEGYYDYEVTPEVTQTSPPTPVVRIAPGPRFTVAEPKIEWVGAPPESPVQASAVEALNLPPGSPGRAAEVVAAEGRIVAALSEKGYADSAAEPREVIVDHADRTVRPTFRIAAKGLVRLDGMTVRTRGRTNPDWVRRLAPWNEGERYVPVDVAELERRLLDTGVYDSVTVALAPDSNAAGLRPIVVSLNDRPKGTIDAGASYSSAEGFGVDGRYTLYNRLGRADTLSFGAQYSSILKRVDVQLSLPHWRVVDETLRLSSAVYKDDTDAYEEKDAGVRFDLIKRLGKTSFRTLGLGFDLSDNDEKQLIGGAIVGVRRQLATVTGLAALTLDRSDNPLNPTAGWKVDGRLEPTVSAGDGTAVYVRATAQGAAYLPLDEKATTVLAGRLRLGSILGGDIPTVPGPRRFFAGGAGSVRGYAYQAVGPRFPDETPIGGLSLVEASLEARHNFTRTWGGVVFVDAGSVGSNQYPDFNELSVGVGVGVRYNLSFAPIRVDIGFPLNRREGDGAFQVYVSLGQAF